MNNLFDLKDFVKYSDTFIETGTCAGDGLQRAIDAGFFFLRSVELDDLFYVKSLTRFNTPHGSDKRSVYMPDGGYRIFRNDWGTFFHPKAFVMDLYKGDSRDILPHLLSNIDKTAVIFLDAHPAGPGTAGHDDLMEKGSYLSSFAQDKIILAELEIIRDHAKAPHIILIDDVNGDGDIYIEWIKSESESPADYKFQYADQQLGDKLYKQKILCCIPAHLKPVY